jgi:small subunit ribosomal protein S5
VIPPSASAARLQKVVKGLRGYNKADRLELEKKYTPAQLAALEAGEAAISPHDIAKQGAIRRDRMGINYIDDFATIRPYIDKPIRAPEKNYDPNLRFKEDDEIAEDLTNWAENLPENPTRLDWLKFADNVRVTVGKEEAELNAQDSLAPELPKMTDAWMVASAKAAAEAAGDEKEHDADLRLLAKRTGRPFRELKRIRLKTLVQRRVVNQTRLGKVQSQYYLTVAGNGRGLLGIGEGKSAEMLDGKRQSLLNAIRNMRPIKRYEERTIYGDVKGKVGATELVLMTRPPGTCPICLRRLLANPRRLWHSMPG